MTKGEKALLKEVNRIPSFAERCHWHEKMSEKFNSTGKSPMELSESIDGQKILDAINEKVSASMIKKFGK